MKSGRDLDYSFANVAGTSPGPIVGRGARRKLFRQTKLSFTVMEGGSPLVKPSTNRKRELDRDRGEAGDAKRVKVSKNPDGQSRDFEGCL